MSNYSSSGSIKFAFWFVKLLFNRLTLFFFVLFAVGFWALDKADIPIVNKTKSAVINYSHTSLSNIQRTLQGVVEPFTSMENYTFVYEKNKELREKLEEKNEELMAYRGLEVKLALAREEMKWLPEKTFEFYTAPVTLKQIHHTSQIVWLNTAELADEAYEVAVYGNMLVGRVLSQHDDTTQVMLITDSRSYVPVLIGAEKIPAIAAGRNDGKLLVKYLEPGVEPEAGMSVITSGSGGVFPPGLLVGTITIDSRRGIIEPLINPFFNSESLTAVHLLKLPEAKIEENEKAKESKK